MDCNLEWTADPMFMAVYEKQRILRRFDGGQVLISNHPCDTRRFIQSTTSQYREPETNVC